MRAIAGIDLSRRPQTAQGLCKAVRGPDPRDPATPLLPRLTAADVIGIQVGLRPGRAVVRLEAERPRPGRLLVHDYGHGGAGVTLSLGCAEAVLALVQVARARADAR